MIITTFPSRQFNPDAGKAKKAAEGGPVFITDRGRPAHVLLSFEKYKKNHRQPYEKEIDHNRPPNSLLLDFVSR